MNGVVDTHAAELTEHFLKQKMMETVNVHIVAQHKNTYFMANSWQLCMMNRKHFE